MSKHDPRVTINKYIISMILAVAISLGAGVGCGYYIAQYREQYKEKNKVDTTAQDIEPSHLDVGLEKNTINVIDNGKNTDINKEQTGKEEKQEKDSQTKDDTNNKNVEKITLTKSEQGNISRTLLNSYYSIDSKAYANLLESSNSKNTVFKEKLYNTYKNVLSENSLANMKKVIDKGTIESYYFSDYYNSKRNTTIKSIDILDYKDNIITARATITNSFIYYSIPNSSDFFANLKGKGLTKDEYVSMVMAKPKRIKVIETRKDQFDIKNINNKWYIVSDKSEILSTEIIEVIFEDKTYTLQEFKNKFL